MGNQIETNGRSHESPSWARGLIQRISGVLGMGGSRSPWDFSEFDILPMGISDRIMGSTGVVNPSFVRDLSGVPHFEPSAYYLLIKALQPQRDAQRSLLMHAMTAENNASSGGVNYRQKIRELTEANIDLLPPNCEIIAGKIRSMKKAGPSVWENGFQRITNRIDKEFSDHEVFIQAYASLLGLEQFLRFSRLHKRPVNLLVEDWFLNPDDEMAGYRIDASKGSVDFLSRKFTKPSKFIIVDDAVKTWGHIRRAWGFITETDPRNVVVDSNRAMFVYRYDDPKLSLHEATIRD